MSGSDLTALKRSSKAVISSVLDSVPLLSGLTKIERTQLAAGLVKQTFNAGSYLMRTGETGDKFYIIVQGNVEVLSADNAIVATLTTGDYAGEQALLHENATRNASLRAANRVICLICDQKLFQRVIQSNSSIKFAKREAKRHAFITAINYDDVENDSKSNSNSNSNSNSGSGSRGNVEIAENTVKWLLKAVADNLLFTNFDQQMQRRILQRMTLRDVKRGEFVIKQGDKKATTFYVVESGDWDVLVDNCKVHAYKRGGCFGELALINDAPRAASVKCVSKKGGRVWVIERRHFRYEVVVVSQQKEEALMAFLPTVPLFKPLLRSELLDLSSSLEEVRYKDKSVIFKQGDHGERFFVIYQGAAEWRKKNGEKGLLRKGQFFGERALRTKEPRAATIIAKDNLICLEMANKDFFDLLGPVIELVDDQIMEYTRSTKIVEEDAARKKENEARRRHQNKNNKNSNGSNSNSSSSSAAAAKICDLLELQTIGILGKGGFGLVTLVVDPHTKLSYALKSIKKFQVIELELQKHIVSEKQVMDMMNNQFLVNLHRTYNDPLRVYFLLDACLGGELFTILRARRYFNEPTSRFYAACVIESFDYMHSMNIIYRDLKPENLVLDSKGYLKVTDFGFAKVINGKTFTLCGTPDYLCPEIVTGQGHGKGVDWWTLGILIYEMLASFPPFVADDPIETYRKIIRGRIRFPRYFSAEVRDLIKGLLHNKPTRRLGILRGGANNIRKHSWYSSFSWAAINDGSMPAPIVNKVKSSTYLGNFAKIQLDASEDQDAKPIPAKDDFGKHF